jgi:ParB family chromosome partitioning protein
MDKRLGRGLESLIPNTITTKKIKVRSVKEEFERKVMEVDVEKIIPNSQQPRKNFEQEALEDLAKSIKEHGILQPLILVKTDTGDDKYQVLAGERRLKASKLAGLKKVPAIIRTATEQQKLELALVENVQRKDLNPIEEAFSFQKLITEFNLTQEKVADRIGKDRSWVSNHLRLFKLPKEIQDALAIEKITMGHAKAILALKEERLQKKLFNKIANEKFSVRETEDQVKKVSVKSHSRKVKVKDAEMLGLEEKLKDNLSTKVEIKKQGKKGQIIIDFYSNEELYGLVDKIAEKDDFSI